MKSKVQKILDNTFKDILERVEKGYLIDWTDLSMIYHAVLYCNVPIKIKWFWLHKLFDLELSSEIAEAADEQSRESFHRVNRIMSIGNEWNDDEWSLVLLLRLELEMVKDFFAYKNLPFPPLELAELCQKMKKISENSKNKKAFSISVAQMKKYSQLPFVDIWFQADESEIYKR